MFDTLLLIDIKHKYALEMLLCAFNLNLYLALLDNCSDSGALFKGVTLADVMKPSTVDIMQDKTTSTGMR